MTARPIVLPARHRQAPRAAASPDAAAALIAVALFFAAVVLPMAVFEPAEPSTFEDWRGNSARLPAE
jgi:hypothetical protein